MRRGGKGNACLRVWAGAPTARGGAVQVRRGEDAGRHHVPDANGQGEVLVAVVVVTRVVACHFMVPNKAVGERVQTSLFHDVDIFSFFVLSWLSFIPQFVPPSSRVGGA